MNIPVYDAMRVQEGNTEKNLSRILLAIRLGSIDTVPL